MAKLKEPKVISMLALTGALFAVPWITTATFLLFIMVWMWVYIVLCGTFRFITLTGDWTFAHVPLMSVGGYTSALLTMRLGWSFLPAFFMAGVVAVVVGLIIYRLCLRARAITFFWLTWAFGEIIRQVWIRFPEPFGGSTGMPDIPSPVISIPGLPEVEFVSQVPYYYMGLVLVIVTLGSLYLIERSRIGLTLKTINDNWELTESLGMNVFRYRLLALTIGTFFVGIIGSFYAHWIHILAPADFSMSLGLLVLLYVIVGGTKTMWGPVIGVVTFVLLAQVLRPFEEYILGVYGLILILVMTQFREGLESLPGRISPWVKKRLARIGKEA